MLTDAGVINYDQDREVVELCDQNSHLLSYLTLADDTDQFSGAV